MQVSRKTRNLSKYLGHLKAGERYVLGLAVEPHLVARLQGAGFSLPLVPGERLLPSAKFGAASRRNADGYDIVHRDQPMETAFRQMEWRWTQFNGRNSTEEMSKLVDVPYKRYPRTRVPPFSVELEVKTRADGKQFATAGAFANVADDLVAATNTANMLREVLGGFEVLGKDLTSWVSAPVRRLNWQLLPPGRSPWQSALPALQAMVARAPAGNQTVLKARLAAVGAKLPDFVAVGQGGFEGYAAFGFVAKRLCVLESPHVNNATYVLPMDSWEAISQMSKAEVLDTGAHTARLVHNQGWFDGLEAVLAEPRKAA